MLYAEFRRHLGKAGMTINSFAAFLCVRPASVSNYSKSGSVPRTYAIIAILLGDAADRGINAEQLLKSFGVAPTVSPAGSNIEQLDMFRTTRKRSSVNQLAIPRSADADADADADAGGSLGAAGGPKARRGS